MVTSTMTPCVCGETRPIRYLIYPNCSTTVQPNVKPVFRPSVHDDPHRSEDEGFNATVARFEEPPDGDPYGCHTSKSLPAYGTCQMTWNLITGHSHIITSNTN
jgi:hypothetical protein